MSPNMSKLQMLRDELHRCVSGKFVVRLPDGFYVTRPDDHPHEPNRHEVRRQLSTLRRQAKSRRKAARR